MKIKSMKNKRALSEIVSYVLLIVIAIGISAMVYAFLQLYTPKEKAQCPTDVSLAVDDYTCAISTKNITLAISNRGLWTVDAAYVRIGIPGQSVKDLLTNTVSKPDLYLNNPNGLPPANSTLKYYKNIKTQLKSSMELEITPAVLSDTGNLVLCNNAIITQPIACK